LDDSGLKEREEIKKLVPLRPEPDVVLEGYLMKKNNSKLFTRWQSRLFVLTKNKLCYYKVGNSKVMRKGIFNFDLA
jgi:hypothetical protein